MIRKILNKTGLSHLFYKVQRRHLLSCREELPSYEDALHELNAFHPDPHESSIGDHPLKKKYDLEIILPAYNVEEYLEQCIESILSQKCTCSMHLIIVDDGSEDHTGEICDRYKDHENVLVIHQKNRGLSGARNTGMNYAEGRYLMFVDSDDYLAEGCAEELMSIALKEDADIVSCAWKHVTPKGLRFGKSSCPSGRLSSAEKIHGTAWGSAVKAELFQGVIFPEGYWNQDSVMRQIIYPRAKSVYGVNKSLYFYRTNPAGITRVSKKKNKCVDSLWITLQLYEDRKFFGLQKDQDYYEYILRMIRLTYKRTESVPENIRKDIFVIWKHFLETEFSGDHTERYHDLEAAVRNGNCRLYEAWCRSYQ